jgi:two-component system, NarL family, invasion response regulator UvrY
MELRVLVADDHAVVRKGVLQILAEDPDILRADEAASGRAALRAIQEKEYDVLLLDIAMPEGGGLDVLEELRKRERSPHVLILSIYSESQYAVRALKSGADGYLTKDSLPAELLAAIHRVAEGRKYLSTALAEQLALQLGGAGPADAPHKDLSGREFQVMSLLAAGKSVAEIAAELGLSVSTVSTYRGRILEKLGVKNTAGVIRYAIRHGLAE